MQNKKLKVIFLGCTKFSESLFKTLLEIPNIEISALFTIPENFNVSYNPEGVRNYNYADLKSIAGKNKIPVYEVDSSEGKKMQDYLSVFQKLEADVILALGWYFMVPKKIRETAKLGAWGLHASLLPDYAGHAPLVWAIIEGQKETGVTLFKLDDGVDDGDIVMQKKFLIETNDTIKEVYEKATKASEEILIEVFENIDSIKFTPQDKSKIKVYPHRTPEDGLIDLSWEPQRIKNFIRAQTKPYPGAFVMLNGEKISVWNYEDFEKLKGNV
jgi:methionyl-tRNA formyltransferase